MISETISKNLMTPVTSGKVIKNNFKASEKFCVKILNIKGVDLNFKEVAEEGLEKT